MSMKRAFTACLAVLASAGLAALAAAQGPVKDARGWTGITNPAEVIGARQALMIAIEELMRPIDTYTVDGAEDAATLTAAAETIAAMLLAVPHLFPPPTNLYDPEAEMPATLALPKIWEQFPTFYAMAAAASTTASTMAEATNAEQLRTASLNLRASCDACHELYLRPYIQGGVTQEDLDFDFDSIFPED
jgi:cytochrome c556